MKISRKSIVILLIIFVVFLYSLGGVGKTVYADELSDNIEEQINNLDLGQLEDFFNQNVNGQDYDFFSLVNTLLKGEYSVDYANLFQYLLSVFFSDFIDALPIFILIIAISILYGIVKNISGDNSNLGVKQTLLFVCLMMVVLLLSSQIISLYKNTEIIIKNIAKLIEIMSPIIVTLMLAVGANSSASVYTPTVSFLSNGVVNIMLTVVLPLVGLMTIFNVISSFSDTIKLTKFTDFFTGVIKWVVGLTILIFSFFMSVQGITSAHFDGVSIRAAKYAISNSIPIVGGFIKDGFDLVVAGSVLIKNTIGICSLILLFVMVLSPILRLGVVSILLKLTSAVVEPISEQKISSVCNALSKTITYLTAILFVVALMFFICVLLMIFSANAFI